MNTPQIATDEPIMPTLEDLALPMLPESDEDFKAEDFFELIVDNNIIGIYQKITLKDYIDSGSKISSTATVRQSDQEEWQNLFSHPYFQRRSPKLVSAIPEIPEVAIPEEEIEEYYLLIEGVKMGPLLKDEVENRISNQNTIMTDMICTKNDISWKKAHEFSEFDRRKISAEHLPGIPTDCIFEHEQESTTDLANKPRIISEETEAVVNLAFMGQPEKKLDTKYLDDTNGPIEINEEAPNATSSNPIDDGTPEVINNRKKWFGILALIIILSLGAVVAKQFLSSSSKFAVKSNTTTKKRRGLKNRTRVQKLTPIKVKTRNNLRPSRTVRRVTAKPAKRSYRPKRANRVKPQKNTRSFDKNDSDEFYYDDSDSPVELDPIKSRISKKTIDPISDSYAENRDEIVRIRAREDFEEDSPGSEDELFDEEASF